MHKLIMLIWAFDSAHLDSNGCKHSAMLFVLWLIKWFKSQTIAVNFNPLP